MATKEKRYKMGAYEYTQDEIAMLKEIFGEKNNPSGTTPTSNPLYGPYQSGAGYGTFSYPGIRPDMYSAFQRPRTLARLLGVKPSVIANDKIGIMTGVTDASGTNPADFCGTAVTAGQLKRCVQNYVFGDVMWKTQVNNVAKMGLYVDYADMNKRLANLAESQNPFIPDIMQTLDISNRDGLQLANELFNIGVALERYLEIVLVRGNSTLGNASTQLGFIREFNGLERQVITGRRDFDTNALCPAADSQVISWGGAVDATISGRTFVQVIVDTIYGLNDIATRVGMDGVTWAIVMPMRMFRPLTYVWSCQYWTYACQNASASNPNYTNGQDVRMLQLAMQAGYYLLVDGKEIPVIFSDGIRETRALGNTYTADEIFIIPVDWNGQQLLNLYYKPMDNPDAVAFANFDGNSNIVGINNGMFLYTTNRQNFCYEHVFAGELRVILEAPFLAAEITTIQYTYNAPFRSAYPSDTISYVNGGVTRWDGDATAGS